MDNDNTVSLNWSGNTALTSWQILSNLLAAGADYERDCAALALHVGRPVDQVSVAISRVAAASTHSIHEVPDHLLSLIENEEYVKNRPTHLPLLGLIEYPTECEQGCIEKFYKLLGVKR